MQVSYFLTIFPIIFIAFDVGSYKYFDWAGTVNQYIYTTLWIVSIKYWKIYQVFKNCLKFWFHWRNRSNISGNKTWTCPTHRLEAVCSGFVVEFMDENRLHSRFTYIGFWPLEVHVSLLWWFHLLQLLRAAANFKAKELIKIRKCRSDRFVKPRTKQASYMQLIISSKLISYYFYTEFENNISSSS